MARETNDREVSTGIRGNHVHDDDAAASSHSSELPSTAAIISLLHAINVETHRYTAAFARARSLHITDVHALAALLEADQGGTILSAGDLGEQLRLSLPAVTALLDRMAKAGYLHRGRKPSDRRIVEIHVTPKAVAAGRELCAPILRNAALSIRDTTEEERTTIARFLIRICEGTHEAQEGLLH